jgi:hypothetical protein
MDRCMPCVRLTNSVKLRRGRRLPEPERRRRAVPAASTRS